MLYIMEYILSQRYMATPLCTNKSLADAAHRHTRHTWLDAKFTRVQLHLRSACLHVVHNGIHTLAAPTRAKTNLYGATTHLQLNAPSPALACVMPSSLATGFLPMLATMPTLHPSQRHSDWADLQRQVRRHTAAHNALTFQGLLGKEDAGLVHRVVNVHTADYVPS